MVLSDLEGGDMSISNIGGTQLNTVQLPPIPKGLDPQQGDIWAEKQKAKVDDLQDGPRKDALLKMLADHEGKGWTFEETKAFKLSLKNAQFHDATSGPKGNI